MKKTTLKTIMMSAAMLLGMGLVAVPQAMAGSSVFATYKLPFGLQIGKPVTEKIEPYLKFKGDVYRASSFSRDFKKRMKGYLRKSLGVQTLGGKVVSVIFFHGKYPKLMRGVLSKGMSAEKLKKLLREQGGKEIGYIPPKELGEVSDGFITAVFGSYQYAFSVEDDDGEKTGLRVVEILEYEEDY